MKITILISLIVNIIAYVIVILIYFKDCKEIGKNNLAVNLKDRLINTFLFITMPCVFGLFLR